MSEAVVIALIAAGVPAAVTLILYGGRMVDWAIARREKRREERQRKRDQEEARKTTRALLETIRLKDERIAMQEKVIADLLALNAALRDGSRR